MKDLLPSLEWGNFDNVITITVPCCLSSFMTLLEWPRAYRLYRCTCTVSSCVSYRYRVLDDYPSEQYTDVYWIKYVSINSARVAKRKLDNRSFFGKSLHICYAPEYESIQETREKLQQRRRVIALKTRG